VCVVAAGDDPNYWMWVTREAHAEYMTKKVRKLLAEVNEPGNNEVSVNDTAACRLLCRNLVAVLTLPSSTTLRQPEDTTLQYAIKSRSRH
jgi:hypothetical protein